MHVSLIKRRHRRRYRIRWTIMVIVSYVIRRVLPAPQDILSITKAARATLARLATSSLPNRRRHLCRHLEAERKRGNSPRGKVAARLISRMICRDATIVSLVTKRVLGARPRFPRTTPGAR
jgi:hypothetical protein